MTELEKSTDILSSLYTLRAGLSVIAQENYAIASMYNSAKNNQSRDLDRIRLDVSSAGGRMSDANAQLSDCKNEYYKNQETAKTPYSAILSKSVVANIFALLFLLCSAGALITLSYFQSTVWRFDDSIHLGVIAGFAASLICGVVAIIILIKSVKKLKVNLDLKKSVLEARRMDSVYKGKIAYAETAVEQAKNMLATVQQGTAEKKKKIADEYYTAMAETKKRATAAMSSIKALNSAYSYLIDMRDWANLDVIIYAIETKRADNMKEALGVLDGEKRADRLASAITQASHEISRTLNSGFRNMEDMLNVGFNRLVNEFQGINSELKIQTGLTEKLIDLTCLQNALIANANESSAALAQKVDSIKDLLR